MSTNRAYYALFPPLKSQSVLRTEKIKIFKALLGPVATNRAECWALKKILLNSWLLLEEEF
jgi:hypothetical protein